MIRTESLILGFFVLCPFLSLFIVKDQQTNGKQNKKKEKDREGERKEERKTETEKANTNAPPVFT